MKRRVVLVIRSGLHVRGDQGALPMIAQCSPAADPVSVRVVFGTESKLGQIGAQPAAEDITRLGDSPPRRVQPVADG